ncbi:MAG: hypothetical protein CMA57_04965 [Euryarchaeota archaeon]|jgi:hypothetical protein|nr:hypothetical protein [Euryarchaeota archaeon]|tara:strand:- start:290 stop:811 length:522 start_codon:yes stop_codon:yes gene_type:complete
MLYNAPAKGDDGLYFVKALNDSKRKCLVQLNKVKVADVSGDIVFELASEANVQKIGVIDTLNLEAARENCETWFGKQLSEKVIEGAYTSSVADGQVTGERIEVTKAFNAQQESVDIENVQAGKVCDVILEFAGLWFAKKSFGSSWNVVQVRVHPDPILDTYPEEYAFVDEVEE